MVLAGLAAGALALAGATGCGDGGESEDGPAAALSSFVTALEEGDAGGACDLMASETLADLEVAGSCEDVMSSGLALIGEKEVEVPDYEITGVSVDGDRAEATLVSSATEDVVPLVREDGEWKLEGTTHLDQIHPASPLDSDSGEGEVGG